MSSHSQIAHVWAQQTKARGGGRTSNVFFEGASIYSYGHHFKIAQFVTNSQGQRAVLFTNRTYSNSTAKHKSHARSAIYGLGVPVFYVPQVDHFTERTYPEFLEAYVQEAVEFQQQAKRARSHKQWKLERAVESIENAKKFAAFFGLPFTAPDMGHLVEAAEEARKQRLAIEAEQKRKQREQDQADAAAWLNGVGYRMPYSFTEDENGSAYLRMKDDRIETSRGASVPREAGIRLFRFIKRVKQSGKPFIANGHRIAVGHFHVRHIKANGDIQVGCHFISWGRIEEFAVKENIFTLEPLDLSEVEERAVA